MTEIRVTLIDEANTKVDVERPARMIERDFDAGRGCPFVCSFCSIINVHGRKSRFRSPDDVERVIRENRAQGTWTRI